VLPAGVAIVAAITQWMNPNRIEISHSGIRTGLLIDAVQPVADAVELEAPEHGLSGAIREVTVRENARYRGGQ